MSVWVTSANRVFPYVAPLSGQWLRPAQISGQATTNAAGVANRILLAPAVFREQTNIDQIAINVTTGVGAALARILVYSGDLATGLPAGLLYDSGSIDVSANGVKTMTQSLSFLPTLQYWFGVWSSSTASLSCVQAASTAPIPQGSAVGSGSSTIARTLAYASAAPDPWTYVAGEESSALPFSTFVRKA